MKYTPDTYYAGGHAPGTHVYDVPSFGAGQEHSNSPTIDSEWVLAYKPAETTSPTDPISESDPVLARSTQPASSILRKQKDLLVDLPHVDDEKNVWSISVSLPVNKTPGQLLKSGGLVIGAVLLVASVSYSQGRQVERSPSWGGYHRITRSGSGTSLKSILRRQGIFMGQKSGFAIVVMLFAFVTMMRFGYA
jgi:hypothetical protein